MCFSENDADDSVIGLDGSDFSAVREARSHMDSRPLWFLLPGQEERLSRLQKIIRDDDNGRGRALSTVMLPEEFCFEDLIQSGEDEDGISSGGLEGSDNMETGLKGGADKALKPRKKKIPSVRLPNPIPLVPHNNFVAPVRRMIPADYNNFMAPVPRLIPAAARPIPKKRDSRYLPASYCPNRAWPRFYAGCAFLFKGIFKKGSPLDFAKHGTMTEQWVCWRPGCGASILCHQPCGEPFLSHKGEGHSVETCGTDLWKIKKAAEDPKTRAVVADLDAFMRSHRGMTPVKACANWVANCFVNKRECFQLDPVSAERWAKTLL
jgi:hypothetical protein